MSAAIIRNSHMLFDGVNFFRGGAIATQLAEYGRKKTPVGAANFLEVVDKLPLKKCKIERIENIEIDFKATRDVDFSGDADLTVAGAPGKVSGKAAFSKLKDFELVLTLLVVNLKDLETAINASKPDREELLEIGARARVVNQTFVVTTAKLAEELKSSQELSLSTTKGGGSASISANGSSSLKSEVELPRGSTFAYLLADPEFDSSGRVVSMTFDQFGLH